MKQRMEEDSRVKRRRIRWKQSLATFGVMLLLVGLQVGIIVFPGYDGLHEFFKVNIVLLYWVTVTAAFTYVTNRQIRDKYDGPMRTLSEATKRVADGDFSVYVEPPHTADKYDYIDVMFLDFNKMVAELGSIETLKNDFIGSVSHELKTPLAVIKNYSAMLEKSPSLTDEQREYTAAIDQAAGRLSALITNILRLNKLENQSIEAAQEPYDLCRQLADCFLSFEPLWEAKNITVEVDIEDRAMITADESMMEIVWNNLIANAIKFTEPGGSVALKQTSDAHSVTVSVSDSGAGMTQETIRHIFDKFYQGDTSHSSEGNGLGLALAQRAIEKAGGTLTVESEPGRGSIFTVRLGSKE